MKINKNTPLIEVIDFIRDNGYTKEKYFDRISFNDLYNLKVYYCWEGDTISNNFVNMQHRDYYTSEEEAIKAHNETNST